MGSIPGWRHKLYLHRCFQRTSTPYRTHSLSLLGKGRYTRGSLLPQHAPATRSRSKAPSSAPTISSEKICCAAKLLLPSFAPSYQTGLIWGSKVQGQICCTGLFQEQALSCVLKFACPDMKCLQLANQIGLFFSSTTVPMPQSGCFIIQLPRRVLRVYWLGVLTRERVSGACFRSKLPRVCRP